MEHRANKHLSSYLPPTTSTIEFKGVSPDQDIVYIVHNHFELVCDSIRGVVSSHHPDIQRLFPIWLTWCFFFHSNCLVFKFKERIAMTFALGTKLLSTQIL